MGDEIVQIELEEHEELHDEEHDGRERRGTATSAAARQQQYKKRQQITSGMANANRRGRARPVHAQPGRSVYGMQSVDMTVVQLASLKKQYIAESIIIKAQRKRMKEIEKDVANLKKEERGLGVKKAKARKMKLDMHLQKMTNLVVEEQKAREQAQKDVAMLTEEVGVFSAKFEEICREVDGLMSVKQRLEAEIETKKKEFDDAIHEQHKRLKDVEVALGGMDKMLFGDNLVRNKIGADKGMVEEIMDKMKELLAKEEENIEADKEFLLKAIKEVPIAKPSVEQRARLSSMVVSISDRQSSLSMPRNPTLLSNWNSSTSLRSASTSLRGNIDCARESYKSKRESTYFLEVPSFY